MMSIKWKRSRRMVLRNHQSERDVGEFAAKLGWPLREVNPADPDEGINREVVWYATPHLVLHHFDDDESQHGSVLVTGEDAETVRATAEIVEAGLDTWRPEELLTSVDRASDPEGRATAVIRAGLGAPGEFDVRFFKRICAAMHHPDPRVRESALWATSYEPWPAYRPALEEVLEQDPEEDLREMAGLLLESFGAVGGDRE